MGKQSITFNATVTVDCRWSDFKAFVASKGLLHQFVEDDNSVTPFAIDGDVAYKCFLVKAPESDVFPFTADYDRTANDADLAEFEASFRPTGNRTLDPRTQEGRPRVASEKATSSRTNFYSHDFTDPTTWYQKSIRVVDEVPVDSGDHLTFSLTKKNIIDLYHGLISLEDFLKDAEGNSYRVTVTVDGVTKVEQDPHFGAGGDFAVNYLDGKVVFLAPQTGVVKVTYHYANGSTFTVAPQPGKRLILDVAEVQFATDVVLNDTFVFEVMGYADAFLTPAQMVAYGIPAGAGVKISLNKFIYKSFSDFENDAFKSYPAYPAIGGTNWRAQLQPVTVFDWDYVSGQQISSKAGMEIRVSLEHDVPCGGYMGTATFYCRSEDEA
jgi:hypothetical protein